MRVSFIREHQQLQCRPRHRYQPECHVYNLPTLTDARVIKGKCKRKGHETCYSVSQIQAQQQFTDSELHVS